MPPIKHIFLDDGGVLNDNSIRAEQWPPLLGEFFAPNFGGTPEAWAEANRRVFFPALEQMLDRLQDWDEAARNYEDEWRRYMIDWLDRMFHEVGIDLALSDNAKFAVAVEANKYGVHRVQAAYPGAQSAVFELSQGYELFTASSGTSFELVGTLSTMGIAPLFQQFYGTDLVNMPKNSPRFYERVFADAGVDPASALVVDDSPRCLGWAREAGAGSVVLVSAVPMPDAGFPVISRLFELPVLLQEPRAGA
jgi:FMN phosphatase YigB (HAD superfamily)